MDIYIKISSCKTNFTPLNTVFFRYKGIYVCTYTIYFISKFGYAYIYMFLCILDVHEQSYSAKDFNFFLDKYDLVHCVNYKVLYLFCFRT